MKEKKQWVAVDIETLGTTPGSTILSIGALVFDPKTGDVKSSYEGFINPLLALQGGYGVDLNTMMWWMKQEDDARAIFDTCEGTGTDMRGTLEEFATWWKVNAKDGYMLSHDFDKQLLRFAFEKEKIKCPWHFRDHLDQRTFDAMVSKRELDTIWEKVMFQNPNIVEHSALGDAKKQAFRTVEILERVNVAFE